MSIPAWLSVASGGAGQRPSPTPQRTVLQLLPGSKGVKPVGLNRGAGGSRPGVRSRTEAAPPSPPPLSMMSPPRSPRRGVKRARVLIGAAQVGSTWRGRGGLPWGAGGPQPTGQPRCPPHRRHVPPPSHRNAPSRRRARGIALQLGLLCFSLPTPDGNLEQAAAAETPRYIFQA